MKYLLIAALLGMPSMAAAESEFSMAETRALMHAYARCVVAAQPVQASEAIARNADNSTIMHEYRRLIVPECLSRQVKQSTQMRFTGDLYRYALADALVSRELASKPAPDFEKVPRLTHREPDAAPTPIAANGKRLSKKKYEAALKSYDEDVAYSFLSKYGECVVRVDPTSSKSLLMTTPDSAPEAAIFNTLQPAFARCLAEGQTLKFGKVALRGTIAINYYRLARAGSADRTEPGASK